MNQSLNIVTRHPKSCSKEELEDFIAMARAGGEVGESTLAARVRAAECLVFLFENGCLRAIAALKKPLARYRNSVSEKTGNALEPTTFPYELGYVFVLPSARGHHLSRAVVGAALSGAGESGVWATSRTDNAAMHRTLSHFGFCPSGRVYASGRGSHAIQLFIRAGAQPRAAGDALQSSPP